MAVLVIEWLRLGRSKESQAIHPQWRVGQYVTYFFAPSDGSWTAFAITIEAQTDDGAWILRGDFKTARGESTAWFRSDPRAKPLDIDPLQFREELVRGSAGETTEQMLDAPFMRTSLALNLLMVRRHPTALGALRSEPRSVSYPCGIDRAHRFITPGPGYEKHHDLNPGVMITGVACLSANGGENPIIATSFGGNSGSVAGAESYDDFVDLSHCKLVHHDRFRLSYPATWFLRPRGSRPDRGTTVDDYSAGTGGGTCACHLALSIRHGAPDQLTEIREQALARFSGPMESPMGRLMPHPTHPHAQGRDETYSFRLDAPTIDGVGRSAVRLDYSGTTLAQITLFGSVAKANPLREPTLRQMDDVFRDILNSFQFATNDGAA